MIDLVPLAIVIALEPLPIIGFIPPSSPRGSSAWPR
jgi:hypothetical protein